MKLTELDTKNPAIRALKESFGVELDLSSLSESDLGSIRRKLSQVRGLLREAKKSPDYHQRSNSPAYMKLVFAEQALSEQYNALAKPARVVVENVEVDKSQVILAAQDVVDSIQKMVEKVSDVQIKQLPPLVNSIQSQIGVNESKEYATIAGDALTKVNAALQEARAALQEALNKITGQSSGADVDFETDVEDLDDGVEDLFADEEEAVEDDAEDLLSDEEGDLDLGLDDLDLDDDALGGAGRAKRQ